MNKMIALTAVGLTVSSLLIGGAPAFAQSAATPASPLGGPAIPNLCLLSQQAVLSNAKVGLVANARLKQITDAADAELTAARAPIEADAKMLQAQTSLKPAEVDSRRQALAVRVQALQQIADQRRREVELTRQKALAEISGDAQPVIAQVYKAHSCGLLVDRNSVLGGNMTGDLTGDVVKGLDAKITTITFDRAVLPAQTASAGQAATRQ